MRILLVNNLYDQTSVGGAEQVVRVRARRWVSEGHTVYVVATCQTGAAQCIDIDGVRVEYIVPTGRRWLKDLVYASPIERIVWHIKNLFDVHTANIVVDLCKELEVDVVETHNLIGVSMQLPRALHRSRIAHHHYLHDVQLVEPSGILAIDHTKDSLLQHVYSLATKYLFRHASVVYSPTAFLKQFYASRGFFRNAQWKVEHENLIPIHTEKSKKHRDAKKVYLFVGYLGEHKGIDILLAAWQKKEKKSGEQLLVVGDGHLRPLVEKMAQVDTTMQYVGRIAHDEIGTVYERADVLVFPSQCIENRPNVIAEAMAQGLEIIAIKTGGVEEMTKQYTKVTLLDTFTL